MSQAVQRLEMDSVNADMERVVVERHDDGGIQIYFMTLPDGPIWDSVSLRPDQAASLQWFLNRPLPKTKEA